MDFSLVYLIRRFFYRLLDFFHHWYIDASRYFANYFFSFLERLDRVFALKITLRYFFAPLYKDYTPVGRILGIIFRSIRIVIALFLYLSVSAVFLTFYFAWLFLPVFLITNAFRTI